MARSFRSGSRQVKSWTAIPSSSLDLTAGGTTLGTFVSFAAPDQPATILRMVGGFVITGTEVAPVAGDEAHIMIGVGIFSTDAVTAGSGSVPDPESEPSYPWLFWRHSSMFFNTTDPSSGNAA